MNSFKKILIITILLLSSANVFADNHSTNTELVEKAKEITKEIENKQSQVDEDEVPLNDPFAGNEGSSTTNSNMPTDEEEQGDKKPEPENKEAQSTEEEKAEKFYLLKMKLPALVGKKDFDKVFKNSDASFSSGPFVVVLKKKRNILS